MPIEHSKSGATIITGDSQEYYRLCVLKGAVGLECKGIKMRRGPVVWKQVAAEFGIKGNKQKVHQWLCDEVERLRPLQEHVDPDGKRFVGGEEVQ